MQEDEQEAAESLAVLSAMMKAGTSPNGSSVEGAVVPCAGTIYFARFA